MLLAIISLLIGLLLGGSFVGIIMYRHLCIKGANAQTIAQQEAEKLSLQLEIEEQEKIILDNEDRIKYSEDYILVLNNHITNSKSELREICLKRDTVQENVEIMEKQSRQQAQAFYDSCMSLAQEKLEKALEEIGAKYQSDEEAYKNAYLETVREYVQSFEEISKEQNEKYQIVKVQLEELQNAVEVAVAAAKREGQKRQEKNFYRLTLPESDLNEIQQLRAVEPYLRDKEALNKVIWKVYYEKPYTDLIGRVVGPKIISGIYKITNIENQMCYVGQAVNIADRWKQHIKRGIGAEPPTRNKLYPAMQAIGVENFTFEILEECGREKLDAQEDYWQEFFHAKDFGYSIK